MRKANNTLGILGHKKGGHRGPPFQWLLCHSRQKMWQNVTRIDFLVTFLSIVCNIQITKNQHVVWFHNVASPVKIRMGFRGSEVQILSPRPRQLIITADYRTRFSAVFVDFPLASILCSADCKGLAGRWKTSWAQAGQDKIRRKGAVYI